MNNRVVLNRAVHIAVDKAVFWAVWRAVSRAVDEAVDEAVFWAVWRAVSRAVNKAVDEAVWRASPHPNLEKFLMEVGDV